MASFRLISAGLGVLALAAVGPTEGSSQEAVPVAANMVNMDRTSVIRNVFQSRTTVAAAQRHCEQMLELRLQELERAVSLSAAQRGKLELAGKGDIHRFFTAFATLERSTEFGPMTQPEFQQFWSELSPLRTRYAAGLHGQGSLLVKILSAVLEPDQQAMLADYQRARELRLYRDRLRLAVQLIDRKVPMTEAQRESLLDLALETTEPPEQTGEPHLQVMSLIARLSTVPDQGLEAIFTPAELPFVQAIFDRALAMDRAARQQRDAQR